MHTRFQQFIKVSFFSLSYSLSLEASSCLLLYSLFLNETIWDGIGIWKQNTNQPLLPHMDTISLVFQQLSGVETTPNLIPTFDDFRFLKPQSAPLKCFYYIFIIWVVIVTHCMYGKNN